MAKSKLFRFFGDQQLIDLLTKEELIALKKIRKGVASEYDQKIGYIALVNKICRLPCSAFHEISSVQSFNEGVRHVGQLLSLIEIENLDNYKDKFSIKDNTN